ncbi:TonB-dependent receptor [Phenylobacterium sp.]|uniref:TonB-dependent receptor n=1 Tax=Phenylobacterium sp. TaxID=1871053 RepID=UPI00286EAEBD|nr:TonB-dependent receptor [Phenylobacterium sp.]
MFLRSISRTALLSSISALALPLVALAPQAAFAADAGDAASVSELIVTATRRDTTIQDTPVNIAAVGGEEIKQQGFDNLAEITRFVPGIFIVDQGARQGNNIIVRGLNATALGSNDGNNDGGGTVATYVGDIPLFVDLKLNDIERVEFLLGPQGTLYGAGTLGGAIRYIPTKPRLGVWEGSVRGDTYGYAHGSNPSIDVGFTLNAPLGDTFAIRASVDFLDDQGFIDQPFAVSQVGISDPDPDFTNPTAVRNNLHGRKDVNTEETVSGRLGLRWTPTDAIDLNLTYYYQNAKVGGRQVSGSGVTSFPVPVDKWESVLRVTEPNEVTNQLLALEGTFDLGFADLTSATGLSKYKDDGRRDQTDLLIGLEYSYEAFPSFTAFTNEQSDDKAFTQELRLVSKSESALSWIVGAYYNSKTEDGFSKEFTPFYDAYLKSVFATGPLRPDSVEYYSVTNRKLTESAGFGEVSYEFTDAWQVTLGGRYYTYDLEVESGTDLPLYNTTVGGRTPVDAFVINYSTVSQKDKGWLFKFNTSYKFSDDVMTYFTVSEGYRIGSDNGVGACPTPLPTNQIVCALPNETEYLPDKTLNYELGLHSQWFDKRLTLNGALYYIQWKKPQVDSATANGLQPITINGGDAESKGIELNFAADLFEGFTLRGSYMHNETEFTETTPNLIPFITPPGFQGTLQYASGEAGDRLPGSPEDQGSLFARYETPLFDGQLAFGYGVTAAGEVLTRAGNKGGGVVLPAYAVHNLSVEYQAEMWKATLYADNLFDTFVKTGARNTPAYNQVVTDDTGANVYQRGFYYTVLPPRRIGIRFERSF